ncbi:MAG: Clp1/GlmU family protein [Candidatus Hermodarchaeia archaeon]|jgi:polynucleotide 5'-hydroxyl-kinase GRC3/NOL9
MIDACSTSTSKAPILFLIGTSYSDGSLVRVASNPVKKGVPNLDNSFSRGQVEVVRLSERAGVLVRGPAKIVVSTGSVDVLGKMQNADDEFMVSYGKTYPLQALSTTQLEVFLGSSSQCFKVKGQLIPIAWKALTNLFLGGETKVAMVLGDTDTGKSSLVLYTANRLSSAGYKTAVVDADVGQSTIGAPGVVGLCLVESPTLSLKDLPYRAGYFVGDKNPSGHFLDMVLGTKRMVVEAFKTGAEAILIDTTGMVRGGPARALKEKKIEAVSPDLLAALQRDGEVEHLLAPFKDRCRILRLPVPPYMRDTGRVERIALRGVSMRNRVKSGKRVILNLNEVILKETFLGTGVVQPELKVTLANVLRCGVLHVEEAADVLIVVVKGTYILSGVEKLKKNYDKAVKIVRVRWLDRLMLGLLDADERLLDIGFLESIRFEDRQLIVFTRLRDATVVKYVKFGYLRIDEQGNELGRRKLGVF